MTMTYPTYLSQQRSGVPRESLAQRTNVMDDDKISFIRIYKNFLGSW